MALIYRLLIIFGLLAATGVSSAFGEGPYSNCKGVPSAPRPIRGTMSLKTLKLVQEQNLKLPVLAQAIAFEINSYLEDSKANLEELIEWLAPLKNWESVKTCGADQRCILITKLLPYAHGQFRKLISLSLSSDPIGWQLWKLDVAGNPNLWRGPFMPEFEKQIRLTPRESELAQQALTRFWDGVIEDFMNILDRRIDLQIDRLIQRANDKRLLQAFEQTRKQSSLQRKVEAAMLIADQGWDSYRRSRLTEFQRKNRQEIWRLIDQLRPLAYITDAIGVSPENIGVALQKSIRDVTAFQEKIRQAAEKTDLVYLSEFPVFIDDALKRRPDLCDIATSEMGKIATQERMKMTAIMIAVSAPLVLMVPSVGALVTSGLARGTVASIGLTGSAAFTLDLTTRSAKLQEAYMGEGKMDSDPNGWLNSNVVAPAQIRAAVAPLIFFVNLGLPHGPVSGLRKLLQ